MIIPFLSSTLAKMNDILTWDPRRVRNLGSRYFSEPRKNEKIKSLKIFLLGIISWQSHWAEWSKHYGGLPSLRKRYQECPASEQNKLHTEQSLYGAVFPNAAQAPEKSVAATFPSKYPSCHFPFFWSASSSSLSQPTALFLIISLWLARFLSIW